MIAANDQAQIENGQPADAPTQPSAAGTTQAPETPGNFPVPQAPQAQPQAQTAYPIPSAQNYQRDIGMQVGGAKQEAQARGQAGTEQAGVYQQQAQQLQDFNNGMTQRKRLSKMRSLRLVRISRMGILKHRLSQLTLVQFLGF